MNKCPSQSAGGGALASISTVSSISEVDVIVVVVVVVGDDGGGYTDAWDVLGSYTGCSVTVVDSTSVSLTSVMIVPTPLSCKF